MKRTPALRTRSTSLCSRIVTRPRSLRYALLLGVTLGSGCHLLVDVPVKGRLVPGGPAPLTGSELLRFTIENLGEIEAGLAYRSASTNRGLLEFLVERVQLGYVVNLRQTELPFENEVMEAHGGRAVHLPMWASENPTPTQVLELIRLTHLAREEGRSILVHCRQGADRTGMFGAIWRMLFQGVRDYDVLRREAFLHRHVGWSYANVRETIRRFRPELFMPFVENPDLLDDPAAIAALEARYHEGFPVLSGSKRSVEGSLAAGVGKASLLEGLDMPVPMATYGPLPGSATGVRSPVEARAVLLDNGAKRLAIVQCDLLIMDVALRDEVLQELGGRGVEVDDILLAATHTHTGIGGFVDHWLAEFYIVGRFRDHVRRHLVTRIADAIGLAASTLRPARIGIGRAFVEGMHWNRRFGDTVDPEVGLLKLEGSDGKVFAVIASYAGHPVLEPSDARLSGDYPGYFARRLDARYGFGLFLQGALGDLNARSDLAPDAWQEDGLAQRVATRLLEGVERAVDRIETESTVELGSLTVLMKTPATNVNAIPDLLFPLEWLLIPMLDWPRTVPVQVVRIGDCALVGCSTELGVRLGRRIKRRSPAGHTFVLSHANSYGGYAVTQFAHPRGKLDPTSVMANNGPTYGPRLVETACDLLEVFWGERLDPAQARLSPAERARVRHVLGLEDGEELPDDVEREAIALEEADLLLDRDVTLPQTPRHGLVSDSLADRVRLRAGFSYLDGHRGGAGIRGRVRELELEARFLLPLDLRADIETGLRRSTWNRSGVVGSDEGFRDVAVRLERPFDLFRDPSMGNALRAIPVVGLSAPTGDPDGATPYAFAIGQGVWRPRVGGALELVWETGRAITVEGLLTTSTSGHDGRRPGDRADFALGYRERHGLVSLSLEWGAELMSPDERRGGRRRVDVGETSWSMEIRPGMTFHLGESIDLEIEGTFPVARSGDAGAGQGIRIGVGWAWGE